MSIESGMKWRALGMLCRAKEARELIKHSGLYGEHNEGLLIETLREFLPREWEIGSGEVIDVDGERSPQCDVIVYNGHTFPPAHRSKAGKVVVFAHAVGAVVEVKSTIHSAKSEKGYGDVQALGTQLADLRAFLDAAINKGTTKILEEALHQGVDASMLGGGIFGGSAELAQLDAAPMEQRGTDMLARPRVAVYGVAYSSLVSSEAIKGALPLTEDLPQVFVLDAPRSADKLRERLAQLAQTGGAPPTKDAVLQFAEEMREPNGYTFEVRGYTDVDTQATTRQVDETALGTRALRTFIKELSDTIRRSSPLSHQHSAMAAEVVYSAYNTWEGTYA